MFVHASTMIHQEMPITAAVAIPLTPPSADSTVVHPAFGLRRDLRTGTNGGKELANYYRHLRLDSAPG